MASFTSTLQPVCYSSELTGFSCFTSAGAVTVRMYAVENIFENTYRSDGYFMFPDYSDIIENFMIQNEVPVIDLNIEVTDDNSTATQTVRVLFYKAMNLTYLAEEMLDSGMLTTYRNRTLYNDFDDYITLWCPQGHAEIGSYISYALLMADDHGNQEWITLQTMQTIHEGLNEVRIFHAYLRGEIPSQYQNWRKICMLFRFNGRTCTFYFSQAHAVKRFAYRNCFNALEYLSIPCTSTKKVKTDHSVAVCGKYQYLYDIVHERTHVEQTAALDSERCLAMEQLLTSPTVKVQLDDYNEEPIIITSYTYEPSNEPNQERSFKFEWQFQYRNGITLHTPVQENRLFSRHFMPQFS